MNRDVARGALAGFAAGFLAAFSGFNYALVSATDARLRQNAFDAATSIVRRACALRVVLLARSNRSVA